MRAATTGTGDLPAEVEERVDVTVVIPAYNEEDAIAAEIDHVHKVLEETGKTFEIIVVDDFSTDKTADIAETKPCRVIRQHRNMGYGASLKRGFRAARSEYVIITDADGTYPAEEMPKLLERADDHDMVVGARIGENVHIPLIRRPPKWVLRVLASYLAGEKIPDLNSGMRLIRRSHVARFAHILPSGFSFTTTITLSLLCSELDVGYVTIDYKKRIGASKIRPTHAYHFLMLILRVIVLFNPLKVFLPLGAVTFLAGLAKFSYDVTKENLSESAIMFIIASVVIWALGLLADQNSRLGLDREMWD
jgi:glycosyltransferase involved in cell wall biosynthesis